MNDFDNASVWVWITLALAVGVVVWSVPQGPY